MENKNKNYEKNGRDKQWVRLSDLKYFKKDDGGG